MIGPPTRDPRPPRPCGPDDRGSTRRVPRDPATSVAHGGRRARPGRRGVRRRGAPPPRRPVFAEAPHPNGREPFARHLGEPVATRRIVDATAPAETAGCRTTRPVLAQYACGKRTARRGNDGPAPHRVDHVVRRRAAGAGPHRQRRAISRCPAGAARGSSTTRVRRTTAAGTLAMREMPSRSPLHDYSTNAIEACPVASKPQHGTEVTGKLQSEPEIRRRRVVLCLPAGQERQSGDGRHRPR